MKFVALSYNCIHYISSTTLCIIMSSISKIDFTGRYEQYLQAWLQGKNCLSQVELSEDANRHSLITEFALIVRIVA